MSVSSRRNANFQIFKKSLFCYFFFRAQKSTPEHFWPKMSVSPRRNAKKKSTPEICQKRALIYPRKCGGVRCSFFFGLQERIKRVFWRPFCLSLTGARFRRCGTTALVLVSTEFKSLCWGWILLLHLLWLDIVVACMSSAGVSCCFACMSSVLMYACLCHTV